MPHAEPVAIDVTDVVLDRAPDGQPISLGTIGGVQIVVLLRHRH